jgi:hypothetical protein
MLIGVGDVCDKDIFEMEEPFTLKGHNFYGT